MKNDRAIVLFDGVCNFCNARVNFMIRHDKKDFFRFAPIQSEHARKIFRENGLPENYSDSFILFENGKIYQRTSAALRISKHLDFPWMLFYPLVFLPPFLRDWVYVIIAKNRYKWFGKRDSCMVPTEEVRKKFL
ncbi:MAG TPA: thiol-disulfide oxidoreductase DCC family protein [Bacteroidia bacterium]|jgi:predicted DCC family thiol-disulfide oxidoreductase YuxK|nr:thiol-disulfide oxidoreductase DCC family protein [Bacteroidia bacterium]